MNAVRMVYSGHERRGWQQAAGGRWCGVCERGTSVSGQAPWLPRRGQLGVGGRTLGVGRDPGRVCPAGGVGGTGSVGGEPSIPVPEQYHSLRQALRRCGVLGGHRGTGTGFGGRKLFRSRVGSPWTAFPNLCSKRCGTPWTASRQDEITIQAGPAGPAGPAGRKNPRRDEWQARRAAAC